MKKIGIIGCGNIGSKLARFIEKDLSGRAILHAICDAEPVKISELVSALKIHPKSLQIKDLIDQCDIIIEAANAKTAAETAREVVRQKKTVLVMSSGGFIGNEDLFVEARKTGANIHIVSGAIAGLDAVKSARLGGIESVQITTRKPPEGLTGAPYLLKNKIDLSLLKNETVIFSGNAREAIEGFPKNVNVACTLSFAALGLEKTRVNIVACPKMKTNSHEVVVKGKFGEIRTITDNLPSPENPKTSYLAVLSAMATLSDILSNVHVGT